MPYKIRICIRLDNLQLKMRDPTLHLRCIGLWHRRRINVEPLCLKFLFQPRIPPFFRMRFDSVDDEYPFFHQPFFNTWPPAAPVSWLDSIATLPFTMTV